MQKPFVYRYHDNGKSKGNCFANCIVKGCELQGDKNLNTKNSELSIFNLITLKDFDETKEFEPALCYLVNNNYTVKIIDPDPYNGLWGRCFKGSLLARSKGDYEKEEIEKYSKNGWSVIFSTKGTNDKPHAILSYLGKLYDPENDSWKPYSLDEYMARSLKDKRGRFLIAFIKIVDKNNIINVSTNAYRS